ncbi:lysylphosphatidylglycerol synthase transmembrane domain-containing protein [Pseudoxanthomonas sp. J35]|uniref:lysylphosphatidylglycerol synthase transmembrane domain-containing protein n=1 Tax=Pseudoxanthomonas sp. J35 TaxID=935852 RepID=UPI0004BB5789|nr:lysylphosphatidylglycerol synthase transmembrane domain-containing protein [Pseudoxanthomonas sp. J35]
MPTGSSPAEPAAPAPRGKAAAWILGVATLYLAALWYVDRDNHVLSSLAELAVPLGYCALLVLASYGFRYQRWRRLLHAQGHETPWLHGLAAYLAGFAFTASPGKAGELLRIRYFAWQGVPAQATLTTFIFERALDLLVITLMATGAAASVPMFGLIAATILALLLTLMALACWPPLGRVARKLANLLPGTAIRRLGHFLVEGACAQGPLMHPRTVLPAILHGAAAWSLTALAFTCLSHAAGVTLSWQLGIGIYPAAMLVGALSFIPGGVGTTEAAIVFMLGGAGVQTTVALTIAIGIRLASLWLAVMVGMLAMATLEAAEYLHRRQ